MIYDVYNIVHGTQSFLESEIRYIGAHDLLQLRAENFN